MAEARHLSVVPDPGPVEAYEAMLDLLAEDEAAARFESACRRYVIVPDGEVLALRAALVRRVEHHRYEHVEAAFYALALEELPGSWAAGRERLRLRIHDRDAVGGTRFPAATAAIESLMHGETAWLKEMWLLAEDPPDYPRLREVAARVWVELRRRGQDFQPEHFSEHVHEVLHAVFPHSPGAALDRAWADDLYRRAESYLDENGIREALATEEEVEHVLGADRAIAENDHRRYRRVLREWLEAARDASDGSSPSA